jgi:molecular chaperone GrpE (heat shock protein)
MTLWETQLMEEDAAIKQWEELNYIPGDEQYYVKEALNRVKEAENEMLGVIDSLQRAADWMRDTALEYKLLSYVNDLDSILNTMKEVQHELEQ